EPGPGESIFRHISVVGAPSGGAQPMRQVFWLSFRAAQERLYVTNPYFVPDAMMRRVLKARARAGVDVRVLVPNRYIDVKPIRWASHALFEELLAAGVRIYEYQPTMIHQKIAVIDGVWSLVGSANLDVRSKELNQENLLGILDAGFARELEETFFADLACAKEVELKEFRRRSLLWRIPERVAALFEKQV
ncbi:MAG TPA: phospholipase D-like domain-containing protein, partial [Longimicrobiaceae bacterium]|nr:phospholipase D-like domain-containing protein [Longimicrobiaceae bacterium]